MSEVNLSGVFNAVHDIQVQNKEIPTASGNEVVVKVEKAGICGSDLHIYHTGLDGLIPSGSVLGHEFSGVVHEVGSNVVGLKVGERVMVNPMYEATGLGGMPGGFSNYMKVADCVLGKTIFKLPDTISSEQGALIEPLTVVLAAINATQIKPEDNVLVTGCGTIGLSTIAALKSKGVENIIATDISKTRLGIAKRMGAKYTFNPTSDGDLKAFIVSKYGEVDNLTYSGKLPHLTASFECSGVSQIVESTLEYLAPDGKFTLLAVYGKGVGINPNEFVYKRIQLLGSFFYKDEDFAEAIELTASGKVDLTPIVTHRFPLDELPEAFEVQADSSKSIKVLVDCH